LDLGPGKAGGQVDKDKGAAEQQDGPMALGQGGQGCAEAGKQGGEFFVHYFVTSFW